MVKTDLKRQAMITACSGALVRGMGFALRLWISRALGAEAVGVMELAAGAHALAVTPGAAGLPGAVSRLTARAATPSERAQVLRAGRKMALGLGCVLSLLFFLLSPWISRWLGDERTLPSLWLYAPCALVIALSSVYDGFCFGQGKALPPAVSELTEQMIRLGIILSLSSLIPRVTVAWRAALPAMAAMMGETAGLISVRLMSGIEKKTKKQRTDGILRSALWRLSLPLMLNRLSHTGLHTLCGVIIPMRLMAGGLDHREALSRLGMLNGMVMPLMFLPGLFSGALSAVGGPAIARCQTRKAENRLARRMLLSAFGVGIACAGLLCVLAPFLSIRLYRLPELADLMRICSPMAVLLPLQQALNGLMTGLGLQKKSLTAGLLGAAATLLCTWQWVPDGGIIGAAHASMVGHSLTLFCLFVSLWLRNRKSCQADREAAC